MATEDELGWEYFGQDPENSPRMQEHMDWHNAHENKPTVKSGNYGERFLIFHRDYVGKFDAFRIGKGLLPVSGWDPATPIPANLDHPHVLMSARDSSNPAAVDPGCVTPTWATLAGGSQHDPLYGYTKLTQFQSLDELGRSIDDGWHGKVHNTIGGDMMSFMSPIDPVFWRWHKWIDGIRAAWDMAQHQLMFRIPNIAAVIRILYGGVNDAPGLGLTPGGTPVPIPGGPGDPLIRVLQPAVRDALTAALIREVSFTLHNVELRAQAEKLGASALKVASRQLQAESR
jgi:hypothetical protein